MNIKQTILFFTLTSFFLAVSAKEDSKFYAGGGLGASFGSVTSVMVNPFIAYRLWPKTSIGMSATYEYYKNNTYDASTSIYGGSVFLEQFITKQIFVKGEYELLSLESKYFDKLNKYPDQARFLHHGILTGAGYKQQISNNSSFFILGMVNITQTENSPYGMPIIKLGFTFH